jgi:uracil-xanthine permease
MQFWKLHGDGRAIAHGSVVMPEERMSWPRTFGLGVQHVLAMFGATVIVPLLIEFPVSTTLFFAGVGTLIFVLLTKNRVPSWTGSSFAFIAPVTAAQADGGMAAALGGIVCAGVLLAIVGLIVDRFGYHLIEGILPPVVTGSIVAIVGLNLAPVAESNFSEQAWTAFVTLAAILIAGAALRGFLGRMSIFIGVAIGYAFAATQGQIDLGPVGEAAWLGWPEFTTPSFDGHAIVLIAPAVILVLLAENAGHVKAVAAMTDRNLDPMLGRSFMGDGLATMVAGLFGGSGTTTYAENIGVMSITRVYSTAAYIIAAFVAIAAGLVPKFGALIGTIPIGVIGGAATVLFGLIAVLGARVWIQGEVDFRDPINLVTAAVALTIGAGNYTLVVGDYTFGGITLGTVAAIVCHLVLRRLAAQPAIDPEGEGAVLPTNTAPSEAS